MKYKFEDLDLSKPLYAITEFLYNGRMYKPGEAFPWRTMAIGRHRVVQLWNARKIRHTVQGAAAAVEPAGIPATVHHTGAGWYNVEVDGLGPVNPSKIKGADAAKKWAAENGYLTPDE